MRILLTNDDGIRAPGLQALALVAAKLGEVWIVAPDRERSACGHSLTMRDPLRVHAWEWPGAKAFEVNGVPADCVNVGRDLMAGEVDLVLSGINAGPNLGFDVTYSGTVAGAMEGCMAGVRSIAISLACFVEGAPRHWETAIEWLDANLRTLIELEMPELTFLNINIPSIAAAEIAGMRICGTGKRVYEDRIERREDPWGRGYYWQGGVAVLHPEGEGTDVDAIGEGTVSVSPLKLDWSCAATVAAIQQQLR